MKILRSHVIIYVIIPLLLLFLWVGLSFVANPYENFTSFTISNLHLLHTSSKPLLKGQMVKGEFVAKSNYLGTVLLNFSSVPSVGYSDQDKMLFRIRELGSRTWFYEGIYHAGGFQTTNAYPFGFPLIANSNGKVYVFELISLSGNTKNAVIVKSSYATRFTFNKSLLTHNHGLLISFIFKKLFYSLANIDFILSSFIYLTPLLFYIVLLLASSRYSTNIFFSNGKAIFTLTFIFVFLYSIFTKEPIIGISIFLIGWWFIIILLKKVSSRTSFIFFAVLLALGYIGITLSQVNFSDRISSWAYIFLAFGAFQALFEEKAKK